jgi:hypothetical protein
LSLEQANVFPRLFTPNGDGFNDLVYFVLENPNNTDVKGHVFDSAGRSVGMLRSAVGGIGIGTTLTWGWKRLKWIRGAVGRLLLQN